MNISHKIFTSLASLINNNYIYIDLPYHTNIGDILIWKGTECFLNYLPYKCLYKTSLENYFKPAIEKYITILIHGGGNLGDIWRRHTDFALKIIKEFPENKIVILPQTIYYNNYEVLKKDAFLMGQHKKLTICARDKKSYKLLDKYFHHNNILLLPDMAFCIHPGLLNKFKLPEQDKDLFIKRKDKEYLNYDFSRFLSPKRLVEERDWPGMKNELFVACSFNKMKRISAGLINRRIMPKLVNKIVDFYAQRVFFPETIKVGVKFISEYKHIYTTRLHGAILSTLLNKNVTFFDNSYGKNKAFYETWLKEYDNINFINKD
mgnify:CR=1 FL=1